MDRNIVCYMEPSARDNHETLLDALCSKQKSDPMQNINIGQRIVAIHDTNRSPGCFGSGTAL